MKNIKQIAIFMIMLVVSLPVYSAYVLGEFRIESVYGNDEIPGYRAQDDTTKIKIISDAGDVRYIDNFNTPLACQQGEEFFVCSYEDDLSLEPSRKEYSFVQEGTTNSISKIITVDGKNPEITSFSDPIVNNDKLTIQYAVTDLAYNGYDKGSGVKEVKFLIDGVLEGTINGDIEGNLQGEFNYSIPSDGDHTFIIQAIDYVGNENAEVRNFYVDATPPYVTEAYVYYQNSRLSYVSVNKIEPVKANIIIADNDLLINSVYGDLSDLTVEPASNNQKHVPFTCIRVDEQTFNCTSSFVQLWRTEQENPIIIINSTDASDNCGGQEIEISLSFDDSASEPNFLGTQNCDEQDCYLNNGNNILIATLPDDGAGFNSRRIFLKSPSLFGSPSPSQVESCAKEDGLWKCYKTIQISGLEDGQGYELILSYPSADDVGNSVSSINSELIYDDNPPDINEIIFTKRSSNRQDIATQDQIRITLKASDEVSGATTAYANLEELTGDSWVKTTCTDDDGSGDGEYKCEWTTGQTTSIPGSYEIDFNVTDYAGNTARDSSTITVYNRNNNNVSFWHQNSFIVSPEQLDRVLSQYVPGNLVLRANVQLKSSQSVKLVYAQLAGDCVGIENDYLTGSKLIPLPFQKTPSTNANVEILLELRKERPLPDNFDELKFSCPLSLISAKGLEVYPEENIDVDISVPLVTKGYDLPSNYVDRIEEFKERLRDATWIDSVQHYIEVGQRTCQTLKTITKIYHTVSKIINKVAKKYEGKAWFHALSVILTYVSSALDMVASITTSEAVSWICGFFDCTLMDKIFGDDGGFMGAVNKFINAYTTSLTADSGAELFKTNGTSKKPLIASGEGFDGALDKAMNNGGKNVWEASKKSIIVSTIALCIPGILYNLQKARQIDCMYVHCAEKWTSVGFSPYTCEAMRANAYCNFVYGQVFHLIPLSGLINYFGQFVEMFSSSPWSAVGLIFGAACWLIPSASASGPCKLAAQANRVITFFTETVSDYQFITKGEDLRDWCEIALEEDEEE